ncbi:cytochrome P450 [Oceanicella sp. SM1341]|uniref:cytochrome P450 n=1 Tax=Oceanicella sp. SM1341 TaxID=1548889 RepID=UPI000E4E5A8F|nr:cytochrome P450 [Oceanicella sp. SM1341]
MAQTLIAEDIDLGALWDDPYPTFARLRAENPVAWVPSAGHYFLTRFDDVVHAERNGEIFNSTAPESLVHRVMGHAFIRKDGDDHAADRRQVMPAFSPAAVKRRWRTAFESIADALLNGLEPRGAADLFTDFAAPMAARSLVEVTGLATIAWQDMARWSQWMMDAVGNYHGDPELARRGAEATAGIDAAIDAMTPRLRAEPDGSVLSVLLAAGMPTELIRANVKVIIGGGQNEPRDAIAGLAWALLADPAQRALVAADAGLWGRAFEEYIRWISPIGMVPRTVSRETELAGVRLKAGDRVALLFGSANRDETKFEAPERFDLSREKSQHVAFGAGPHFCAGAWVARTQVAEVALPRLFARLPRLRLAGPVHCGGWVFRGPLTLPCAWD